MVSNCQCSSSRIKSTKSSTISLPIPISVSNSKSMKTQRLKQKDNNSSKTPKKPIIHHDYDKLDYIFACHLCPKKFSTIQALGGHQNAHKKEKNLQKHYHMKLKYHVNGNDIKGKKICPYSHHPYSNNHRRHLHRHPSCSSMQHHLISERVNELPSIGWIPQPPSSTILSTTQGYWHFSAGLQVAHVLTPIMQFPTQQPQAHPIFPLNVGDQFNGITHNNDVNICPKKNCEVACVIKDGIELPINACNDLDLSLRL